MHHDNRKYIRFVSNIISDDRFHKSVNKNNIIIFYMIMKQIDMVIRIEYL